MRSLDEVADTADAAADEQRKVARTARAMQRARDRGASWSALLEREQFAGIVQRLRSSAHRVRNASTRLTALLATGLAAEGESRRRIAHRLGVTHQRVTSMLRTHGGSLAGDE